MPYYVVTDTKASKQHLVLAKNQAQALKAVVEPQFSVRSAEEKELIALTKSGVEVIEAK